jgi:NhaP-type Na+/H+ or K+/H+ antiporter
MQQYPAVSVSPRNRRALRRMPDVALVYLLAGAALLLAAVLPRLLRRVPVSPAMVFVAAGLGASFLPGAPRVDPMEHLAVVEHVTELCVIVSLMGVGLALDRPLSLRGWGSTWRLLGIAMPLIIAATALLAWLLLGLPLAAALLVGAVLAPTDPVLASDVRVGEPTDDPHSEDDLRFALSSEAGLNDGLAFPFVWAAILALGTAGLGWAPGWFAWELVGKVVVGTVVGALVGLAFGRLAFGAPVESLRFAQTAEAVVALSAVFLAYGLAELVNGYGFLAVFVAAIAWRSQERGHQYHVALHGFISHLERILTLGLLLAFGYALGSGLLSATTVGVVVLALLVVLVLRPAFGLLSMAGSGLPVQDRRSIAFFGVKGIGSFYYLAFALHTAAFAEPDLLWSVVAVTVVVSVVVHGATATPVLLRIDRRLGRRTPEPV